MITLTIVYDTTDNGIETITRLFKKEKDAVKAAQEYQADFCNGYDIPMKEHQFGDEEYGDTQFEKCEGEGYTLCESNNTDRLRIYLYDISVE